MADLAINGGSPTRKTLLPYARQSIDEDDVKAVDEVLRSDWLTTGPKVGEFEKAFAEFVGAAEAVAVSNGTTALHMAYLGAGVGPGDEVIVPAMTFAATANAAIYCGAKPVFADVDPATLLVDPKEVQKKITKKTKMIVAVDYAGQPCEYDELRAIAKDHGITLLADACHALGATYNNENVGTLADFSTFSFHPVKPLATGEGGMIVTENAEAAARMRRLRNHGLSTDHRERHEKGSWLYEMEEMGYNERLSDIHATLGLSQLKKVPGFTKRRQEIAAMYDKAFMKVPEVAALRKLPNRTHAYHLYVIQLLTDTLKVGRKEIFEALRKENIGVNVHYIPVPTLGYYKKTYGTKEGAYPITEGAYERIISLPMFAGMTDQDARDVIEAVKKVCSYYRK